MRKLTIFILLTIVAVHSHSQFDSKPSRSRFYNNKMSSFTIEPGDILVYSLSKHDSIRPFVATITSFNSVIAFNYSVPGKIEKRDLLLQAAAVSGAVKYNSICGSKEVLKDESILWLSRKNYRDLFYDRVTKMDMGNGNEFFVRRRTSTCKINFKGEEKILTIYNIENYGTNPKIRLAVLTNDKNPLIIKMDSDLRLDLKEVR